MTTKTSDLIALFLKDKGIKHVFGIVGAGDAHIFDSINKMGYTEIVCVHHEQSAVMAMGTYYRTTGKISATIVTTGAGATNTITGVVSTFMDSIPGLIIAGNEKEIYCRPENPLRIWGVQGYDSTAMVEKVTKYATRVSKPVDVLYELEKSYHLTNSGRPGPVWVEIPMDVQSTPVDESSLRVFTPEPEVRFSQSKRGEEDLKSSVATIKDQLLTAKRPLIWLGHGIRLADAQAMIAPMLEQLQIPALVTWQAIDIVDSEHPLVFGRAGVYGQRFSNFVLQNCDFLLCIGTRMAIPQIGYDRSELVRDAKIACVDIDPLEVEKLEGKVDFPVCADAKDFIEAFVGHSKNEKLGDYAQWIEQCNSYRQKYPVVGPEHQDKNGFINSYRFMDRLSKDMKPDQHVVTDMGTALLSGHQILSLKEGQRLMTSTGLGEMGFGLPAALGVSFGRDRGEVLCLNCDGGMMMNLQELQTIAHHKLPIKIIVFNNDGYLMIKHTQKNLFKGRYTGTNKSTGISCPDFQKVAAAFDFASFQVRTWQDYDTHMKTFMELDGPAICEVFMDPEQLSHPKLGLSIQEDGSLISPPLEDLSPFISRDEMRENMIIGIHPKSEKIEVD